MLWFIFLYEREIFLYKNAYDGLSASSLLGAIGGDERCCCVLMAGEVIHKTVGEMHSFVDRGVILVNWASLFCPLCNLNNTGHGRHDIDRCRICDKKQKLADNGLGCPSVVSRTEGSEEKNVE